MQKKILDEQNIKILYKNTVPWAWGKMCSPTYMILKYFLKYFFQNIEVVEKYENNWEVDVLKLTILSLSIWEVFGHLLIKRYIH